LIQAGAPYPVPLTPELDNSFIDTINNLLKSNGPFQIDLGINNIQSGPGNISKLSPYQIIQQMMGGDSLIQQFGQQGYKNLHERALY